MTTTRPPLVPVLDPERLYLGDNGRCFCGRHAGMSATYTGYDISGHPVTPLDRATCEALGEDIDLLTCEPCGRRLDS